MCLYFTVYAPFSGYSWHLSRQPPRGQPLSFGGSLVGVWNGWGYGIAIFRALNFQISEPEIWQKSLVLRNFRDFPGNSASEKYFSDSGKWPFHTPPIHTPTKCRPTQFTVRTSRLRALELCYEIPAFGYYFDDMVSLPFCSRLSPDWGQCCSNGQCHCFVMQVWLRRVCQVCLRGGLGRLLQD